MVGMTVATARQHLGERHVLDRRCSDGRCDGGNGHRTAKRHTLANATFSTGLKATPCSGVSSSPFFAIAWGGRVEVASRELARSPRAMRVRWVV